MTIFFFKFITENHLQFNEFGTNNYSNFLPNQQKSILRGVVCWNTAVPLRDIYRLAYTNYQA